MDKTVEELIQPVVALVSTWGLQVLGAIAVLLLGRWVAAALRNATRHGLERSKLDPALVPFLSSTVYYLALTVVVIAVLSLFGIETTSLVAVLGAAGLAIGFALQGSLSNVAAGMMLLIFRPFRPGDFVEVAGVAGSVAEIGLFATTLNTPDNVQVVAPNASVYGSIIKNYSANADRRNDLVVGISYTDDIPRAIETVREVLRADARVLADPEPVVSVGELGDSSVDLVVRPWCRKEDYWPLRFDLQQKLKLALEAAGCSIPFPQRDVHVIPPG